MTDLKNYVLPFQMLITSKLFSPKVSISSSAGADIVGKRISLAGDFYQKAGFAKSNALDHMRGVDFSRSV